ncbi:MAG: DUF4332 domain-containing protein [Candidatus Thorarchaeota archaeon]
MGLDWSRVKELTLWQYEELVEKLLHVLSYSFIQTKYDRKLSVTRKMVRDLFKKRNDNRYTEYSTSVSDTLRQVEIFGMQNIAELIDTIKVREDCVKFIEFSKVSFEDLIVLLNCCLRWILPFARPIRDFIETEIPEHIEYTSRLQKRGIKNNLDMIEECPTAKCRQALAVLSEVPLEFIHNLAHRTDISRLPYVRGKTVKYLNMAGYKTLEDIANTSVEDLVTRLEKSLLKDGKEFSRSFIDPEGAVTHARIIPPLIGE